MLYSLYPKTIQHLVFLCASLHLPTWLTVYLPNYFTLCEFSTLLYFWKENDLLNLVSKIHMQIMMKNTKFFKNNFFQWLQVNLKYIYIHLYMYHHHHVVPLARMSLTLSRHFSLSFIAFGRSSELHPVSSHSCCMYVRAGRPAFAWPYVGVHRSTSLISSSLLLQQCPACLARLTCIVFVMGGKWPYS